MLGETIAMGVNNDIKKAVNMGDKSKKLRLV